LIGKLEIVYASYLALNCWLLDRDSAGSLVVATQEDTKFTKKNLHSKVEAFGKFKPVAWLFFD
jgi:hypothetical protein